MGIAPNPIQIDTIQITPVVAMNNSVWIQHWNHVKVEEVSQQFRFLRIPKQKVQNSLHHDRAWSFSRMLSCHNYHTHFLNNA
jgi:hypothetical protein